MTSTERQPGRSERRLTCQQAFEQARTDPAGSTPDRLRARLDTIDEGTLSDGDMDPQVLWALQALERWASFLTDRDPEFVVQLAIRSLEAVDYEVSARLDDFLASPEMAVWAVGGCARFLRPTVGLVLRA